MKKAQSLLDFVLIFGILIGVSVGFTRIWVWFNTNLAKRSVDYQNSRLYAGTANDDHASQLAYADAQLALNDDWIFRGQTSETVGPPLPGTNLAINPITSGGNTAAALTAACHSAQKAATTLRAQADDMDSQAQKMEDFVSLAKQWWFRPIVWLLGIDVDNFEKAAKDLRAAAISTRAQATSIEDQACNLVPVDPYPQFE